MKIYSTYTHITKLDMLRGLLSALLGAIVKILIIMAVLAPLIALSIRAAKISDQRYCALYPKALSCQPIAKQ